jgi:hypothetical protein
LAQFDEQQLYEDCFGGGCAIVHVGVVAEAHGGVEELRRELGCKVYHCLTGFVVGVEQLDGLRIAGNHQVAEKSGEAAEEEK